MFIVAPILLIVSLLLTKRLFHGQLFNPLTVFFGLWSFTLVLFRLDTYFNVFTSGISLKAQYVMAASFLLFFLGVITVALYTKKRKIDELVSVNIRHLDFLTKTSALILLAFLIAVIIKYLIIIPRYGNPFVNMESLRTDFFDGSLTFPFALSIMTTFAYLGILNLGVLAVFKRNKSTLLMILFAFIFVFLNDSTTGMRGGLFNYFILFLSGVMLSVIVKNKKIGIRYMSYLVCACVFFVMIMTVIFYYRSGGDVTYLEGLYKHNYIYLTGVVPTYSYFLDNPMPSKFFGIKTFQGLYEMLNMFLKPFDYILFTEADFKTYYAKNIMGPLPYNTSPYLTYFHSDFGLTGLMISSYAMGFISAYLYFKMIFTKRIIDIQFAIIAVAVLFVSVRGMYVSGKSFWVMVGLVLLQHMLLRRIDKTQKCEKLNNR